MQIHQRVPIIVDADSVLVQGADGVFQSNGESVTLMTESGIGFGNLLWIVLLICFVSFVLLATFWIWKKNHDMRVLLEDLEIAKAKNRTCSETITRLIEDRERLVQALVEQDRSSERTSKNLSLLDYVDKLQGITDRYHRIILEFREDTHYFSQLENAVNVGKNDVMNRTRKLFGQKYSEEEYRLITGLFAGLSPTTLSFMTGVRPGTIRVKKSRFKDRIESLPPSWDKEQLLKELK